MARVKILQPPPQSPSLNPHKNHLNSSWWSIKDTNDILTSTVGKGAGEAVNFYGKVVDNPIAERVTNGVLMKGWRALLFTNRSGLTHQINSFGEKENLQGDNRAGRLDIPFSYLDNGVLKSRRTEVGIKNLNAADYGQYRQDNFPVPILIGHEASQIYFKAQRDGLSVNYQDLTGKTSKYKPGLNKVRIYNLTLLSLGNPEVYVELPLRPKEVEVKPETSWAAIKSMGRNLPMYHYLGGEEELHINVDWYLRGNDRGAPINPYYVINMCRLLKSWTYANGYNQAPPILSIQWGTADIFENEYWILTSASYNLSDFHDVAVIKKHTGWNDLIHTTLDSKEIDIINSGLTPYSATQELIFKKVSDHNTLHQEISNYQRPEESKYESFQLP